MGIADPAADPGRASSGPTILHSGEQRIGEATKRACADWHLDSELTYTKTR